MTDDLVIDQRSSLVHWGTVRDPRRRSRLDQIQSTADLPPPPAWPSGARHIRAWPNNDYPPLYYAYA